MTSEKMIKLLLVGVLCNAMPMMAAMEKCKRLVWGDDRLLKAVEANNLGRVQELLQAKVDVEARGQLEHPLFVAARLGNLEIVKALVAARANIENRSDDWETPLIAATRNGHLEIVKALVAARANIEDGNGGDAPLMVATRRGHLNVVKELLASKANVDDSLLLIAARAGRAEIMLSLLEANSDIAARTGVWRRGGCDYFAGGGRTALLLAAEGGYTDIVRGLLRAKADIEDSDLTKNTALHIAAEHGHVNTVELLLKEKANVDACSRFRMSIGEEAYNSGQTPLQLARKQGHREVVRVLKHWKAKGTAEAFRLGLFESNAPAAPSALVEEKSDEVDAAGASSVAHRASGNQSELAVPLLS